MVELALGLYPLAAAVQVPARPAGAVLMPDLSAELDKEEEKVLAGRADDRLARAELAQEESEVAVVSGRLHFPQQLVQLASAEQLVQLAEKRLGQWAPLMTVAEAAQAGSGGRSVWMAGSPPSPRAASSNWGR